MIPDDGIDLLAGRVRARASDEAPPYVLVLGVGCARAAGVPEPAELARRGLELLAPELARSVPDDAALEAFAAQTADLGPDQLARVMHRLHQDVPVPSFDQELAQLVRAGLFPIIVTTSSDTLLEQALAGVGVRTGEVRVVTLGPRRHASARRAARGARERPLVQIVKFPANTSAPSELAAELDALIADTPRGPPPNDVILVGHALDDPRSRPIEAWLERAPERELWWVDATRPMVPGRIAGWAGWVSFIEGDVGRPQVFFPQLGFRLLRGDMSGAALADAVDIDIRMAHAPMLEALAPKSITAAAEAPVPEVFREQIMQSQSVLYGLEQAGPSSRARAQIAYQKRHIMRLEDRMRAMPDVRARLLDELHEIGARLGRGAESDEALAGGLSFYEQQVAALERELGREGGNPYVVSGALGALIAVVDRAYAAHGDTLVDAEALRRLTEFAPSLAGKVVV